MRACRRGHYQKLDFLPLRALPSYTDLSRAPETIAQTLRKNSSPSTAAKNIKKLIDSKLELEGKEYRVDMENATRVAKAMIEAVKRMR